MKKTLLLFVSMLMATVAMAQVTRHHDGFYFDKMSPNGKWLATQNIGSVFIYIQDSDEYAEYAGVSRVAVKVLLVVVRNFLAYASSK